VLTVALLRQCEGRGRKWRGDGGDQNVTRTWGYVHARVPSKEVALIQESSTRRECNQSSGPTGMKPRPPITSQNRSAQGNCSLWFASRWRAANFAEADASNRRPGASRQRVIERLENVANNGTTHSYQPFSLWKFDNANGRSCKLLTSKALGAGSPDWIRTGSPPVNSRILRPRLAGRANTDMVCLVRLWREAISGTLREHRP